MPVIADSPIDDGSFADAMAALGPFEPAASAAVAVSGGSDSMALCLLADRWARKRGGAVLALTVDHRLRPDSAGEAQTVAGWLQGRGIEHRILTWRRAGDGTPGGSLQAAARSARYRLLQQACAEAGILHLLLAHTLDDQAETVLLRLSKGSGVDGLAAMAPVRETASVRLLRPLLGFGKSRLQATCARFGQDWIEDPSNLAPRFARGRLRRVSEALGSEGLSADRLADTARRAGRARIALEAATGDWLAKSVEIFPEGYARLDRRLLLQAPEEIGLRGLSRCLMTIGGGSHAPRLDRLERLYDAVRSGEDAGGRTLGGCRVIAEKAGRLLICREPAATGALKLDGEEGGAVDWDGRFRITLPAGRTPPELEIRRLGVSGRSALRSAGLIARRMPAVAALSLPGLWNGGTLFALPKFVSLQPRPNSCMVPVCGARFFPSRRLTEPAFAVV